jgi:hypothetical protein
MDTARRTYLVSGLLLLAGALTLVRAQTNVADIVDLFSPMPMPRGSRGARSSAVQIPGMRPETVGAVSFVLLSFAGARSVRLARTTAAQQRLRIALPNNTTLVCMFTPERRESGVVVMRGTAEGDGPSRRCSLYEQNGQITGEIEVDTGHFAIVPLGSNNMHAVVEVKTQAFPTERRLRKD